MSNTDRIGDRTVIHTVHDDHGGTEVYWTRANTDAPGGWHGSVMVLTDGTLAYRSWSARGLPLMTYMHDGDILVVESEDMHESYQQAVKLTDESIVHFDSRNLMPSL